MARCHRLFSELFSSAFKVTHSSKTLPCRHAHISRTDWRTSCQEVRFRGKKKRRRRNKKKEEEEKKKKSCSEAKTLQGAQEYFSDMDLPGSAHSHLAKKCDQMSQASERPPTRWPWLPNVQSRGVFCSPRCPGAREVPCRLAILGLSAHLTPMPETALWLPPLLLLCCQ